MSTTHCTRTPFGLTLLNSQHPDIRRLKRQNPTQLHGNKTWNASYLLMDYLQQNPLALHSQVVDIGCGWGLSGIFCAKHFAAEVVAVDADPAVFPYLQLHAEYNNVDIQTQQALFDEITIDELQGFDYLIAADICFWDEMADSVYELIARACEAGIGKIIIADPQRPPFLAMADRCAETFYGEIIPAGIDKPRKTRGALLVIENR